MQQSRCHDFFRAKSVKPVRLNILYIITRSHLRKRSSDLLSSKYDLYAQSVISSVTQEIRTPVRIHSVYNSSPVSITSTDSSNIINRWVEELMLDEKHIIVDDFNLHHSYWEERRCLNRHAMTNKLIEIFTKKQQNLLLSASIITREWTRSRAVFNTWHARLLTLFTAAWVTAANLTWFIAKRTWIVVVTDTQTCVTTCRVWSTALRLTNIVNSLKDLIIDLWIAVFTSVLAVIFTGESDFTRDRTWVIILKRKITATNLYSMLAIWHDHFDFDSTW